VGDWTDVRLKTRRWPAHPELLEIYALDFWTGFNRLSSDFATSDRIILRTEDPTRCTWFPSSCTSRNPAHCSLPSARTVAALEVCDVAFLPGASSVVESSARLPAVSGPWATLWISVASKGRGKTLNSALRHSRGTPQRARSHALWRQARFPDGKRCRLRFDGKESSSWRDPTHGVWHDVHRSVELDRPSRCAECRITSVLGGSKSVGSSVPSNPFADQQWRHDLVQPPARRKWMLSTISVFPDRPSRRPTVDRLDRRSCASDRAHGRRAVRAWSNSEPSFRDPGFRKVAEIDCSRTFSTAWAVGVVSNVTVKAEILHTTDGAASLAKTAPVPNSVPRGTAWQRLLRPDQLGQTRVLGRGRIGSPSLRSIG